MNFPRGRKYVAALKIARKCISVGWGRYICGALPNDSTGAQIRYWVAGALHPRGTLGAWLEHTQGIPWDDLISDEGKERQRITRLAWIDWMIKEARK